MTTYRYLQLDVFTDRPFGGNQLAVFPDGVGIPPQIMQEIAREMAFSETTFVLPAEDRASDFKVRIFTIDRELPMAGHPTIGTTFALAHEGLIRPKKSGETVTLGLGIGPIPVELQLAEDGPRLTFAWMTQPLPAYGPIVSDVRPLARCLGLEPSSLESTKLPVQQVSCGVPFLFVPLATRADVDAASLDLGGVRAVYRSERLEELPVFVFTTDASEASETTENEKRRTENGERRTKNEDRRPRTGDLSNNEMRMTRYEQQIEDRRLETGDRGPFVVYSRMFAPMFGILEDAATGSASGPLGSYLVHHGVIRPALARSILNLQGFAMKRPSYIYIAIQAEERTVTRVRVGGQAVVVGEGTLRI